MNTRTAWLPIASAAFLLGASAPTPPATPKKPVTDTIQGVTIEDPYRWLEDARDPAVQKWSDAQNAAARSFLDKAPHIKDIRTRVQALMTTDAPSWSGITVRHGAMFAIERRASKQQPYLVVMGVDGDPSKERVLVDPNRYDSHGLTAIDFYVPSIDGSRSARR